MEYKGRLPAPTHANAGRAEGRPHSRQSKPIGDVVGELAEDSKRKRTPQKPQKQYGICAFDNSLVGQIRHNSLNGH